MEGFDGAAMAMQQNPDATIGFLGSIVQFVREVGLLGVAVGFIYALYRRWVVLRPFYDELVTRLAASEANNERLLVLLERATGTGEQALDVGRKVVTRARLGSDK